MHDDNLISNHSCNPTFAEILDQSRRGFLKTGAAAATIAGMPMVVHQAGAQTAPAESPTLSFTSVAMNSNDTVTVPQGYTARVLYAWGDPVSNGPAFKQDATNTSQEQELQSGMHHDGMHFFPFVEKGFGGALFESNTRGLLAINHEYSDQGLLTVGGFNPWTAEKVRKAQAAHGVSIIEVRLEGGQWQVVRPSPWARRITGFSPHRMSGPAAGDPLLRTQADPTGINVLGTLNNCAHGTTPWGTYLTCEENFNGYFVNAGTIPADQARYGVSSSGFGYRWHEHDARFNADQNPNEVNRFGWVVEIDPWDPQSMPVKRTALGRVKHEGATSALARDGRVVIYMGDDERFEYIYKFVSQGTYNSFSREANRNLLDSGTLYVARFDANGAGTWIPLVFGQNGLTAANGFASQAEVLIKTRQAADRVGATRMDRPEWIAVHPTTKDVYCTLTNNNQRGTTNRPATDPANPRNVNVFGHIIRWVEASSDPAATTFNWSIFVQCGDPANSDTNKRGNIRGDTYGSPDGLWFDQRGVLWIQTDVSTSTLGAGDYVNLPNNQMLAANPVTGETKRFLVGPKGCEVTGVVTTPDHRTMFVNIQHPGEPASETSDPNNPKAISSWPDGAAGSRPRAATVVITKNDGGIIGT